MGPGSNGPDELSARRERDVAALLSQISYLEEEIGLLRRKVADSPRQVRALEARSSGGRGGGGGEGGGGGGGRPPPPRGPTPPPPRPPGGPRGAAGDAQGGG